MGNFILAWLLIIALWIFVIWQQCKINKLEEKINDTIIRLVELKRKVHSVNTSVVYIYDALHAEMDKNVEKI